MTNQEVIFFSDAGNIFMFEDLADGASDELNAHSSYGSGLAIGKVMAPPGKTPVTINYACVGLELDTCERAHIKRDGVVVLPLATGLDHIPEMPKLPQPFTFESADILEVINLEGGA